MIKKNGGNDMKKFLSKIMAFMLIAVVVISSININVNAASYPTVFFYGDEEFTELIISDTATVGDTVYIRMKWFPVFNNEGYDIVVYDSNKTAVANTSKTFTNSSLAERHFTITWNTEGYSSGDYTVEVTKKFYSYYQWNEAPTKNKLYITLNPKDNGNTQPGNTQPSNTQPGNTQPGNTQPSNTQPSNAQVAAAQPSNIKGFSVKNSSSKIINVKYKKANNAKKYKIQYSTDKKFKKSVKTKTTTKTSYKIKGLKKNKTYYVRVCAVNGEKSSSWTKVKKVKIKK